MSIEDLLKMNVTSVTKVPEEIRKTSAAISVITSEDIRRSGATAVAEVLRWAAGVSVARNDANKWAISIRGFNGRAANKILVMIDGRSIYDPLFSGTLWETRDVFLDDVERIEVLRGPGGSTWGSNAMNGVINIITKDSKDTQGNLIVAGGGSEERAFSAVRNGGKISDDTFYRVYGKYYNRDNAYLDTHASDDSYNGQAGFRIDSKPDENNRAMLAGTIYNGDHDGVEGIFNNVNGEGGSFQGKWEREVSRSSRISMNGYYDHIDAEAGLLEEKRDTGELNVQNENQIYDWFDLIASIQYRHTRDDIQNSERVSVDPLRRTDNLVSAGLTGKMELIKDKLDMRLGSKVEHNDYSDYEFQPDIGVSWLMDQDNTLWASVSKAVRIPSRLENDFLITFPDPQTVLFRGNPSLDSEKLVSYQTGLRTTISKDLIAGISLFYNDYEDLIIAEGATIENSAHGNTHGFELAGRLQATETWYLSAAYSLLQVDVDIDPGSSANTSEASLQEGNSPEHQLFASSRLNLSDDWEFDCNLRYVDSLKDPQVDSYVVGDVRLAYKIVKGLELAVVGQNIFERRHFEQGGSNSSQVQQGVYGKLTWSF